MGWDFSMMHTTNLQASSPGKPWLQEDHRSSQVAKTLPSYSLGQSLRSLVTIPPHVLTTKPIWSWPVPPSQCPYHRIVSFLSYKKNTDCDGNIEGIQEGPAAQCHLMPTPTKGLCSSSLPDMNTSDIIQLGLKAITSGLDNHRQM